MCALRIAFLRGANRFPKYRLCGVARAIKCSAVVAALGNLLIVAFQMNARIASDASAFVTGTIAPFEWAGAAQTFLLDEECLWPLHALMRGGQQFLCWGYYTFDIVLMLQLRVGVFEQSFALTRSSLHLPCRALAHLHLAAHQPCMRRVWCGHHYLGAVRGGVCG